MLNKKKVLVLGAGMVGGEIAKKLSEDLDVSVADRSPATLNAVSKKANVRKILADFSDHKKILGLARSHDIIVGAMPGFLAFNALKNIIPAGKPIVDISFFEEDPFRLNVIAKKHKIPVVVDFGVAPGMSNFLLGHETSQMNVKKFVCYVGGLPSKPVKPWFYKAPFEVKSVIEEYLRPARLKINGKIVIKPALSDAELIVFKGAGKLEAFNTDGLRTVLKTLRVPTMLEKTMRYPGYIEKIAALIGSGFFSTEPVAIRGIKISPKELTTELLSSAWKLDPKEEEFTVMRLIMEGDIGSKKRRVQYDLFDKGGPKKGATSMARTTGYPCVAIVHAFTKGLIGRTGVIPPEILGKETKIVKFVLDFQKKQGIKYSQQIS